MSLLKKFIYRLPGVRQVLALRGAVAMIDARQAVSGQGHPRSGDDSVSQAAAKTQSDKESVARIGLTA